MPIQTANRRISRRNTLPAEQPERNGILQPGLPQLPQQAGKAHRGLHETFRVQSTTGAATLHIPLPLTATPALAAPAVGLTYLPGAGNGILGTGWSLGLASIRRRTDRGVPTYTAEDGFVLSGTDELVPALHWHNGQWIPEEQVAVPTAAECPAAEYRITRYRPRVEGMFARIEQIAHPAYGVFWRVTMRDNCTTFFGCHPQARIADPEQDDRIFEWLPELTFDNQGNCIVYEYKREDGVGIPDSLHEKGRSATARSAALYLKRIRYGNIVPYIGNSEQPYIPAPVVGAFRFEVVFDFGEHHAETPEPAETPGMAWHTRPDAFSVYRSGFELRTYRLLRRVLMFHHLGAQGHTRPHLVRSLDCTYDHCSAFSLQRPELTWLQSAVLCEYTLRPDRTYTRKVVSSLELQYEHLPWNTDIRQAQPDEIPPSATGVPHLGTPHPGSVRSYMARMADSAGQQHPGTVPPVSHLGTTDVCRIDLDGDGIPDIAIVGDDFVALDDHSKRGYDTNARPLSISTTTPTVVFADTTQAIALADMNGDGLADIVRIRNGEVCYWPNRGHGCFGARIAMSNAPQFDRPDRFHPLFLHLADISGTGTTDLLYLSPEGCSASLNSSGNEWSNRRDIRPLPAEVQPASASVVDLWGNGTACIVWPSDESGTSPVRYIDLMNEKRPHLLVGYSPSPEKEVTISYKSSTWFYRQDSAEGRVWHTPPPFPVLCVHRTETTHHRIQSRCTTEYRFHYGYYDQAEHEFGGFGMVEQTDTTFRIGSKTGGNRSLSRPPVLTRTWFHLGALAGRTALLAQFGREYWHAAMNRRGFAVSTYERVPEDVRIIAVDTIDPDAVARLSTEEWREALRSCRGMVLRKEVFVLDAPVADATPDQIRRQLVPCTVATHTCTVELLQPRAANSHTVVLAREGERVLYNYGRTPDAPHITHTINLLFDELGNVLEQVLIAYGSPEGDEAQPDGTNHRHAPLVLYTTHRFTNDIRTDADYQLRAHAETQTFELTGFSAPQLYTRHDFEEVLATSLPIHWHNAPPPPGVVYRRLIAHEQARFYNDDPSTPLPLYRLGRRALPPTTIRPFSLSSVGNGPTGIPAAGAP